MLCFPAEKTWLHPWQENFSKKKRRKLQKEKLFAFTGSEANLIQFTDVNEKQNEGDVGQKSRQQHCILGNQSAMESQLKCIWAKGNK